MLRYFLAKACHPPTNERKQQIASQPVMNKGRNQRKSKSCCGPAVIVQNGQKKISDGSQPRLTLCLSLSESAGSRSLDRLVRHSDQIEHRAPANSVLPDAEARLDIEAFGVVTAE